MMMDWLAKALDLPECFIHGGKGPGGGVIQGRIICAGYRNSVIAHSIVVMLYSVYIVDLMT